MMMKMKRIAAAVLVLACAAVIFCPAVPAMAAVRTVTARSSWRKAPKLAAGANMVQKKTDAFVKFRAPEAGTYTFRFSGLTGKDQNVYGHIMTLKYVKAEDDLDFIRVKCGKTRYYSFGFTTKQNYARQSDAEKNVYGKVRTLKLAMKKGATLYLEVSSSPQRCSYLVTVAKK